MNTFLVYLVHLRTVSTDFLLQEAELLITNLSEERIDREKVPLYYLDNWKVT